MSLSQDQKINHQPGADDYLARKVEGKCTYPGCRKSAADGAQLCSKHLRGQRERTRRSQNRTRAARRRKGQCPFCGARCAPDYACPKHRIKAGRPKRTVENKGENKSARLAARTAVDSEGRTRYRGQTRRGVPSIATTDESDLRDARRYIEKGVEGLAYARSAEVLALPRIQRDDAKMAALDEIHLGVRLYTEVLKRNRYPMTSPAEALELEAEIAATVRRSGR